MNQESSKLLSHENLEKYIWNLWAYCIVVCEFRLVVDIDTNFIIKIATGNNFFPGYVEENKDFYYFYTLFYYWAY